MESRDSFSLKSIVHHPLTVSYLSLLLVQISDGVDQRVGSQDDAGALGPLCAHQAVLAQKDLADVFGPRHPDDGFPQQVGLKDVAVALSARDVKVGTLNSGEKKKKPGLDVSYHAHSKCL